MGVEWGGRGDKFTRRRLVLLLILCAVALYAVAVHEGVITAEEPPSYSPDLLAPCQEDEPCWDCTTMGNRVCGPTTEGAP